MLQTGFSAVYGCHLYLGILQQFFHHQKICGIVIHHQDLCLRGLKTLVIFIPFPCTVNLQRRKITEDRFIRNLLLQFHFKGGTLGINAVDRDGASQEIHQLFHNGKPQSQPLGLA